ncbi:MAG: PRD domain-containing protein [Corynebacterium sp.]|nr:PRD domain-containing protein [Corynebacterium sp.]
MEIIRAINHNAALAYDNGRQVMVLGKGIGFGKKMGDTIDPNAVEQVFVPDDVHNPALISEISLQSYEIAREIAGPGAPQALIIGLADHCDYVVKRTKEGLTLDYPLRFEIAQLYPTELNHGKHAVKILHEHYPELQFSEDEAVAFAMHFINAQGGKIANAELIALILASAEKELGCPLDSESHEVSRFITHIRYLLARRERGAETKKRISLPIATEHPESYLAAQHIAHAVGGPLQDLSPEETAYLALHLANLAASQS